MDERIADCNSRKQLDRNQILWGRDFLEKKFKIFYNI